MTSSTTKTNLSTPSPKNAQEAVQPTPEGGMEEMLVVNSKQEAMSIKAETPVAALTAAFTVVP